MKETVKKECGRTSGQEKAAIGQFKRDRERLQAEINRFHFSYK